MVSQAEFDVLRARLLYVEGVLWSLGRLLTGVKLPDGSTGPGVPPTSVQLEAVQHALGDVLSGRSGTGCPPWCNIDNTGLTRPADWPTY